MLEIINKKIEQIQGKVAYIKSYKYRMSTQELDDTLNKINELTEEISSYINRNVRDTPNPFTK